jgi:hypothetical protein
MLKLEYAKKVFLRMVRGPISFCEVNDIVGSLKFSALRFKHFLLPTTHVGVNKLVRFRAFESLSNF